MLSRIKFYLWCQLGNYTLGLKIIAFLKKTGCRTVDDNTDIVIEGFPRCGNTFAYAAFTEMQRNNYNVAHHIHGCAQIKNASTLGIPTIVLLRNPLDSCASLLVRQPKLSPRQVLKYYVFFHSGIWRFRHKYVITPFETLICNPAAMIRELNAKFDANFHVSAYDDNLEKNIRNHVIQMDLEDASRNRNKLTSIGLPSGLKEDNKRMALERLNSPSYLKELSAANAIYNQFKSYSA